MADLPYGGGKAVIIGDPRTEKSEALFRALGRCIDRLGGRYYARVRMSAPAHRTWTGRARRPPSSWAARAVVAAATLSPVTARGV